MTAGLEDLFPAAPTMTPSGVSTSGAGSDSATEERLLDATDHLVRSLGVRRLNMSDVARTAGVARGTLYRYFESREVLLDALRRRTTERFFSEIAAEMSRETTLAEQIRVCAEVIISTVQPSPEGPSAKPTHTNQATMVNILSTRGSVAIGRTAEFLLPYLMEAQSRGEIDASVDTADASSWLARILLSVTLFHNPASADGPSVSDLVGRYAINGLVGTAD